MGRRSSPVKKFLEGLSDQLSTTMVQIMKSWPTHCRITRDPSMDGIVSTTRGITSEKLMSIMMTGTMMTIMMNMMTTRGGVRSTRSPGSTTVATERGITTAITTTSGHSSTPGTTEDTVTSATANMVMAATVDMVDTAATVTDMALPLRAGMVAAMADMVLLGAVMVADLAFSALASDLHSTVLGSDMATD